MSFSPESVINIKTGSTASFSMRVTETTIDGEGNPVESPVPLDGYSIYMDFINPRTRMSVFKAYLITDADVPSSVPPSVSPNVSTAIPIDSESILSRGITITSLSGGSYEVNAGSTLDWPLGPMEVDILYSKDSDEQHTESFILNMVQGHSQK